MHTDFDSAAAAEAAQTSERGFCAIDAPLLTELHDNAIRIQSTDLSESLIEIGESESMFLKRVFGNKPG